MDWKLLTKADYVTTSWSGGTTTQLSIAPEGAVYADRDFLWRLSSATVELDHSDFTPLPDYNRFLAVLEGEIKLKIDAQEPFPLAPGRVVAFDGGVPVESWGQCVDFNLMVRKGKGEGCVVELRREEAFEETVTPGAGNRSLAVYCVSGSASLPQFGLEVQAGQTLLCLEGQNEPFTIKGEAGVLMVACVREA